MSQELIASIDNPERLLLSLPQIGLLQSYESIGEDFGKKMNIEGKKQIKLSKVIILKYSLHFKGILAPIHFS